jgi:4-hydroxythreonine-4-phosphate dehydrogenase
VKTILITMGDAAGIGPEVIVKLLAARPATPGIRPVVIGERVILQNTADALASSVRFVDETPEVDLPPHTVAVRSLGILKPGDYKVGVLSTACGDAAFRYFAHAIDECLAGRAHGIVTAPLNKDAMNRAGHEFAGHTEILEHMTGVAGPVMALWHPKVVVSHVTDHLSLRAALDAITVERVAHVTRLTYASLVKTGLTAPRIALAGVNPHAGENGLFGREEIEILKPAMELLKREGIETSGPYPGDTVFLQALRGRFDAVLAMYHDQGFGPMKTLDFASGVNCTLGLPFVRTSPDHGTAFEIAGQGIAEPESMVAAYKLAVRLLG